jgi:hypothetical protein
MKCHQIGAGSSMNRQGMAVTLLVSILTLSISPAWALAQTSTGAIEGSVTDNQGKSIPGVKVTVKQTATNLERQVTTNDSGIYRFESLPVGSYELHFECQGFRNKLLTGIELSLGQVARYDTPLEVGRVAEEVTVDAGAALVESANPTIGEVVGNRRMVDLPLNGRNFLQLGLMTAGTAPAPQGGTTATYGTATGGLGFSVGGGRDSWNNFTLDGITLLEQLVRTVTMQVSIDALQEFKVTHNTYEADQGGTPGAQINLTTKSGTNQFHGTGFEFLRNDVLDARNFFEPQREPYRQNQFGGSFGGPIVHDRTFIFGNYEGLRISQSITGLTLLPTEAIRNGDLSGINPGTGLPFPTIIDPQTGQPFPGNRIPIQRIHPLSQALLNLTPLPNIANAAAGQNNDVFTGARRVTTDQFTIRVDHKISDRNQLFGRFTFFDSKQFVPFTTNPGAFNSQAPPGFGDNQNDFSRNLVVGLTTIVRPTLVNDMRVGYNRINSTRASQNVDLGFLNSIGIQRGAPTIQGGIPTMSIPGFANLGDPDVFQPLNRLDNDFEITDAVSWTKGRHSIKFGGDFRENYLTKDFEAFSNGAFTFSDGIGSATGSAWSDFLLDRPFTGIAALGLSHSHTKFPYLGLYFNDDFRVTSRLTLSYGMRYDLTPPPRSTDDKASVFNPLTGHFVVQLKNGQLPAEVNSPLMQFYHAAFGTTFATPKQDGLPGNLTRNDWKNFGPRFGFAYDVFGTGRTVVRASYGIYTAPREPLVSADLLTQVPPYQILAVDVDFARFGVPIPPASFEQAFLSGNQPPGGGGANPFGFDGYVQQYGLDIQQQVGKGLLLEATYSGSTAIHISHYFIQNQGLPNLPGQRRGFRPYTGVSQLFGEATDVTATYHSLTLKAQKRLGSGLSFNAFYTFSKSIDTSSTAAETAGSSSAAQDSYNQRAEKGLSAFDTRHRFVASVLWELPLGQGHHLFSSGGLSHVLGNWQIGGILTLQSGQPFTPQLENGASGTLAGLDRPDRIKDGNLPASQRTPDHWFDTSAFVFPPIYFDAQGAYSIPGNAGRNILIGPGYKDFDFSAQKTIKLKERSKVDFRWEVFNMTNHPNFDLPGRLFGSVNFGKVSSAKNPRLMQASLRFSF